MTWKKFVSDYLTFSKKDRTAVVLLFSSIVLIYSLNFVFPKSAPVPIREDTVLTRLLDTAVQRAAMKKNAKPEEETSTFRYEVSKKSDFIAGELFLFDPNTLDAAGWKKLGLQERTIKTLLNYRNKGGHFYKAEDLKKIWGLPDGFYEHVHGHIQIAEMKKDYASNFSKTPYPRERTITAVDVNTTDTSALIALPGIGSTLARRILNFRDRLGGFYSVDQIGETYGLPDSTFQKLKPYLQVHGEPKKFNINTATKGELKAHPYIKWKLANAIVEYRMQHGSFKKLDELKNMVLIDDATFLKIAPYLTL
jgi:competence protein ComEA